MKILFALAAVAAGLGLQPAVAQVVVGPPAGGAGGGPASGLPGTASLFGLPPIGGLDAIPPSDSLYDVDFQARDFTSPSGPAFGKAQDELRAVGEDVLHALQQSGRKTALLREQESIARLVARITARLASLEMLEAYFERQLPSAGPGSARRAALETRIADNRKLQGELRNALARAEARRLRILTGLRQ